METKIDIACAVACRVVKPCSLSNGQLEKLGFDCGYIRPDPRHVRETCAEILAEALQK